MHCGDDGAWAWEGGDEDHTGLDHDGGRDSAYTVHHPLLEPGLCQQK